MGHKKVDRVQQTSQSVGTGSLQLDGAAPARMRTFANTLSDGDTCWVLIEHQTLAEWEISFATYSGGYISRSFATGSSSSTGTLVSFSAGMKTVSLVAPAGATPIVNGDGDLSVPRDVLVGRNVVANGLISAASATFTYGVVAPSGLELSNVDNQALYAGDSGAAVVRAGIGGGSTFFTFGADGVLQVNAGVKYGYQEQGTYADPGTGGIIMRAGLSGVPKYWILHPSGEFEVSNSGAKFAGDVYPAADGTIDCGKASLRFANIRSVNGSIVTSDVDDKENVGSLSAAEIAVGRRLRIRKWQMKDAILWKGVENARWHSGWVAQQIVADFQAEGLDAFKYGCVGFDLLDKTETYTETMMRPKTEPHEVVTTEIVVVDGQPVRRPKTEIVQRPVGTMVAVKDEAGVGVMVPSAERGDDGQPIMVPLLHFVPTMEPFDEPRTRTVPDLDEHGVQKKRMNVRPDELKAFVLAALLADLADLQSRVDALTPPA